MSHWREYAEWDWVEFACGDVLHAVARLDNEATVDVEWVGHGETECGRRGDLYIPGMFTRMSAKRCERCCRRTHMPQGDGSPKNAAECVPIAEARFERLAAA